MTPVLRAYLLAMAAPAVVLTAMLLVGPSAAPGDPVLLVVLLLLGAGVLCFRRNPATGFHRRQPVDLVFNTSRFMTAGALSALAYGAAGASLAGAVVATAVMYAVSTGLDVIAAADSKPTAALYVAGYLLAILSSGRPWLAVVMMVPIAAIQLALTRSMQLMEQTIAAVESMADVVDRRDPYTFQHSQSVADHAVRTAR